MGGNVPVRSIVSRGKEACTRERLRQAAILRSHHQRIFLRKMLPRIWSIYWEENCGFHVVRAIRGRGSEYNGYGFLSGVGRRGSILGIETEDGFRMQGSPLKGDGFFIVTDESLGSESLEGKQVDVFAVDPQACEKTLSSRCRNSLKICGMKSCWVPLCSHALLAGLAKCNLSRRT